MSVWAGKNLSGVFRRINGGKHTRTATLGATILVALFALPILAGTGFSLTTGILVSYLAMIAMSATVLFGNAGQLSFAYGVIAGLAGYVAVYLNRWFGVTPGIAVIAGVASATLIGVIVAIPALRIRGHQLGLLTLVFSLAMLTVFRRWSGFEGIGGLPDLTIFGLPFDTPFRQHVFFAILAILTYIPLRILLGGHVGRRFLLLKADEATAASFGVNLTREKVKAFALSSVVAGLAGAVYPFLLSFLGPQLYEFELVTLVFLAIILGGRTFLEGALLGAAAVTIARALLRGQPELATVLFGGTLLAFLVFAPDGIIGAFIQLRSPAMVITPSPRVIEPAPVSFDASNVSLSADGVSKRFGGVAALKDVSLRVRGGEIVGLIGANGAGKSTFISCITGFEEPDSGTVRIGNTAITSWSPDARARAGLQRTFQFPTLVSELSVRDNIVVGVEGLLGRERAQVAADHVLERVGLEKAADATVEKLSFGNRKIVDLSRLLASESRILLLDEPAAGVAPEMLPILATILDLMRREGRVLLVVEHNMAFTLPLCDRVVVLDRGSVIAEGSPEDIKQDRHVIDAYLGLAMSPESLT